MSKNLLNFALFQLFWFAAVVGASKGSMWLGVGAVFVFLLAHLGMLPASERRRELRFAFGALLVGAVVDSALYQLGVLTYPTSAELWTWPVVPPWIASLWLGFALLPRFSLAWLTGKPALTFVFGAIGGPLSFLAGTRFGAVGVGDVPLLTWTALALEYAVVTPLLLYFAPAAVRARSGAARESEGSAIAAGRLDH